MEEVSCNSGAEEFRVIGDETDKYSINQRIIKTVCMIVSRWLDHPEASVW